MYPLESIDWAKVTFFSLSQSLRIKEFPAAVPVPNSNFLITESLDARLALDEPQQLLDDSFPIDILSRLQRETLTEIIPHLLSELAQHTSIGSIPFGVSCLDQVFDSFEILHLFMRREKRYDPVWHQSWVSIEDIHVSINYEVIRDFVLHISLRDVNWLEDRLVESAQSRVTFKFTVDPREEDVLNLSRGVFQGRIDQLRPSDVHKFSD